MALDWTNKVNDVDYVDANDVNDLATAIKANETEIAKKADTTALANKVGFTDYATSTRAGVVKIYEMYGVSRETEYLALYPASTEAIDARLPMAAKLPITVGNLDYAVRSVRPNVVQNANSTVSLTCNVNTIYSIGGDEATTSLSITLPATGQIGDFIQIDFFSDISSPTNLTITSNAGFTDYTLTPEGDYIYSLFFDWGMAYANLSDPWGWRFAYAEYPYVENP